MKSKKKERERQENPETQNDTGSADRESFLQAFEKPTQIYRYLRTRNLVSPIFLHRTLSYMKQRRSVRSIKRKHFKTKSILAAVEEKQKTLKRSDKYKSQFINLTFSGFYVDEDLTKETIEVEATLLKVCHKKRKDISSPVTETCLGRIKVPVNPGPSPLTPLESLSIPHSSFSQTNGFPVKSYVLLLSVVCPVTVPQLPNGHINGDTELEEGEPQCKRRRNGQISPFEPEDIKETLCYCEELVIYDRHKRCQLSNGDYELILHEKGTKSSPKQASWETIMDGKPVGSFEVFNYSPTLKFTVSWTDIAKQDSTNSGILAAHNEFLNNNHYSNHIMSSLDSGNLKDSNQTTPKKRQRVFYQFLYNNSTRHQTEARDDMHCPWCSLNCMELYSLLKHLRLCHARFNFLYVPHAKGICIDVTINERYDGSYVGNPQDLYSHIGYAFSRNGPIRRTSVTHVIVYRPKRPEPSLFEFMEPESDNQINKQFMQGHNRLYYHPMTCEPIRPQEINSYSDDQNDPDWLRQKTINMIDEFTDVNEGEKELMKLWNLHVMKYNFISDCQIPEACQTFVQEHGRELLRKNLYRNFILHMVNMFDFSLIRPDIVHKTICMVDELREELGAE